MGAKTPAAGGETKPGVKHEGRPPYHGGCNNANKNNNYNSNASYDIELDKLMFIQSHIHGQGEKQSVCSKTLILKTWILLDSQSTVDVISNGDLLTKIRAHGVQQRQQHNVAGLRVAQLINQKKSLSLYQYIVLFLFLLVIYVWYLEEITCN